MTAKKMPGAGVVNMVYDIFDRLALSQDANQLARGVWAFTKYDALNRPVITGELPSASSREVWQATSNTITTHHEEKIGSGIGYTFTYTLPNGTHNIEETHVLNVSYFDDYSFPKPTSLNYVDTYTISARTSVKGQATGSRTKMLNAGAQWLVSAVYYDTEYRTIQTASELYDLGGAVQRVSNKYKYDLAAIIAEEKTEQLLPSSTSTHLKTFEYDHADRLLSVREKVTIGSMPAKEVTTLGQRYNELGQILQKGQHSSDGVNFQRRTSYTHNIRGWLTDARTAYWKRKSNPADSSFFTYKIAYANGATYTNGNISEIQWSGKAQTNFTKGLSFTYDGVNRLTGSSGLHGYSDTESGIDYDKNGNLLSLNRAGFAVDNLTYQYDGTGNRMSSVTNTGANGKGVKNGASGYAYDANGNMTSDGNRGATLSYNYLNLPTSVVVGGKTLAYDYDAAGTKHKYVADTLTLKYAGAFEYREVSSTNKFSRLSISDGQAVIRKDTLRFDFFVKDHLGNVRVVFDEQRRTLQQTDYYPNGLAVPRDGTLPENARNGFNRYLYNEKELQIGSGYLDYGARMYMPEIGRWGVVDPLSEVAAGLSPFMYANGNPVLMIDPDGMRTTYNWKTSRYENSHGGNVEFDQVKKEYGIGESSGCPPNCPQSVARVDATSRTQNSVTPQIAGGVNLPQQEQSILYNADAKYQNGTQFSEYEKAVHTGIDIASMAQIGGLIKNVKAWLSTSKTSGNAFRYMTEGELKAIQETGLLRGGRPGETFFTKDSYKSALKVQQRLALPSTPTHRVEFKILNNPSLIRNGTKVEPAFGMPGKGAEFLTTDLVKVRLINWQPLGR
ncbi:RHS repeat-associated core domain-containing protein [Dyadobacter sp. LHD-138]|uniref:RHS repeat domain-containing protein n=1 Tax=Dyadobacter sp. LHD-138 TaxID=3071413 RepID=UPI0027E1B28E|nr:RHS repeat-associated core domain-containing protein [Dyadobacter sp. LHD-138]MDQ6482526.1 RHS repeat-associated core domain-containing protein [Dyadobacter sp. LHD-138]